MKESVVLMVGDCEITIDALASALRTPVRNLEIVIERVTDRMIDTKKFLAAAKEMAFTVSEVNFDEVERMMSVADMRIKKSRTITGRRGKNGRAVYEVVHAHNMHGRIIVTWWIFQYFRFGVSDVAAPIARRRVMPATFFKRRLSPRHNRRARAYR